MPKAPMNQIIFNSLVLAATLPATAAESCDYPVNPISANVSKWCIFMTA